MVGACWPQEKQKQNNNNNNKQVYKNSLLPQVNFARDKWKTKFRENYKACKNDNKNHIKK